MNDVSTTTTRTTSGETLPGEGATAARGTPRAVAEDRGVPFGRLLAVELRKMVDTRSGRWLLAVIAVLVLALLVGVVALAGDRAGFAMLASLALQPVSLLLPVVGILAMTSEWSQRTALVTFTLEPRRGRVVLAKAVGALILGVGFVALVAVLSAAATAVAAGLHPLDAPWRLDWEPLGLAVLPVLLVLVQGLAFGLLLTNSAVAITLYYILPMLYGMLAIWERARGFVSWTDLTTALGPTRTGHLVAEQWQQLGVASLIWIVLPLVVGTVLTLRREVK